MSTIVTADENKEYQCSLCGKCFSRRDLRERHRRRCERVATTPRKGKQKACGACVKSKAGCDQQQPRCSRCKTRDIDCEYAIKSTQSILTLNQLEHHGKLDILRIQDSEPGSSMDSRHPEKFNHNYANDVLSDNTRVVVQPTDNLRWIPDPAEASLGAAEGTLCFLSHSSSNQGRSNSGINLLESFGIPSTGNLPQESQTTGDSRFESFTWYPPLNWDELPDIEEETVTCLTMEPEFEELARSNISLSRLPNLEPEAGVFSTGHFQDLGNDENWMQYIYRFPQMMLKAGTYPPFVHPTVYRCSEGEVITPLAIAFCCLGSYNASMRSSEKFAHSMINQERENLIKEFMTRYLDRTQTTRIHYAPQESWESWALSETIRRTILLVNSINALSCRVGRQDPRLFESLGDEVVLHLPLPAAIDLWRAKTAGEWNSKRLEINAEVYAREKTEIGTAIECLSLGQLAGYSYATDPDQYSRMVVDLARPNYGNQKSWL
ncbi:unnamed protein product [Clonostachys rosea]|uniref:Zn(2)-C6 fungal-type domain-containing protein n=1 Tax=Bionectria ochroleuca TaxID=29856 RepID=A0ABY6UUY2_BIOOC|nr:unnamed protein product [Clonostachys rosea]